MKSSISGIQTFTFGQDLVFEAYIQVLFLFIKNLQPSFERNDIERFFKLEKLASFRIKSLKDLTKCFMMVSVHRVHRLRQSHELAQGNETALQGQVRGTSLGRKYQGIFNVFSCRFEFNTLILKLY